MKASALILAAALAAPCLSFAAEPVKFEVYLDGTLKQSVSLVGPHSKFKFSPEGLADTTLEFRLIAPEGSPEIIGRVALTKPGSSVTVSEIKGAKFKHPYVLVRKE